MMSAVVKTQSERFIETSFTGVRDKMWGPHYVLLRRTAS